MNENVCGPEYCNEPEDCLSFAPCKYLYSHVNFFVTRKGSLFSDSCPILFFAEFDNEEDDGAPLLCCQVDEPTPFTGMHSSLLSMSGDLLLGSYQHRCYL